MSLIIATVVRDGIVVAADTRTTIKNSEGHCRYCDFGEKLIPFPNKIVVLSCGDSDINNRISVKKFLYDLRKEIGKDAKITELPLQILNAYKEKGGRKNTYFIVAGVSYYSEDIFVYSVNTKTNQIELKFSNSFGATYNGMTDIAHAIMSSGINYENLALGEAIELTKNCLEENIFLSKFNKEQGIGGECQVYVIDILHHKLGWLEKDGVLREDENANPNAFEDWRQAEMKKFEKQIIEKRIIENNNVEKE